MPGHVEFILNNDSTDDLPEMRQMDKFWFKLVQALIHAAAALQTPSVILHDFCRFNGDCIDNIGVVQGFIKTKRIVIKFSDKSVD